MTAHFDLFVLTCLLYGENLVIRRSQKPMESLEKHKNACFFPPKMQQLFLNRFAACLLCTAHFTAMGLHDVYMQLLGALNTESITLQCKNSAKQCLVVKHTHGNKFMVFFLIPSLSKYISALKMEQFMTALSS